MLTLSEALYEEVSAPRDYRQRRDPQRTRSHVVLTLEESVRRFDQHRRVEILEAFLLLTTYQNSLLRQMLQNPHGKPYLKVITLLSQSTRPSVHELLLGFLDDPQPPTAVHAIIARRRDVPFLRRMFAKFSDGPSKPMRVNARRMETLAWMPDVLKVIKAISADEQSGLVALVMASGINRLEAFQVVQLIIEQGGEEARRMASEALSEFSGVEANQLVLDCLEDKDPVVRANAVKQLRERGIPGAMQRLLGLIDSPDQIVSEAARGSLEEFSFDRLIGSFDLLTEEVAGTMSRLVKKIDLRAIERLDEELQSQSRTHRLRALTVATAMHAVGEVERTIIGMLSDSDHFIRAEAARALAQSNTPAVSEAVRELLLDRSPSVQEAAEQTLQALADAATRTPNPPLDLGDASASLMEFTRESLP